MNLHFVGVHLPFASRAQYLCARVAVVEAVRSLVEEQIWEHPIQSFLQANIKSASSSLQTGGCAASAYAGCRELLGIKGSLQSHKSDTATSGIRPKETWGSSHDQNQPSLLRFLPYAFRYVRVKEKLAEEPAEPKNRIEQCNSQGGEADMYRLC